MYKRSSWKLPFINPLNNKNFIKTKKSISLKQRNLLITKSLLKKKINIHNGLWYQSKVFTKTNLGHKLGEFSFTRRCDPELHMLKKLRKKLKKKK